MLRINKRQLAAFEEAALETFVLETARHIRRVLPEKVAHLDCRALVSSLRARLDQALAYGISDRFDALRYLECSYVLGWTDQGPDSEACAVLARSELTAEERVDLIERRIRIPQPNT